MRPRALCVGINRFPHLPEGLWLRGCVNDAEDFRDLLTGAYGFAGEDVTVLTDERATRAALLDALEDMVAAAVAGEVDHLVVTLSSHGTQVADASRDEPDGLDEAFATADVEPGPRGWREESLVRDDELRWLFGRVPEHVLLDVVLDTCHAGSGLERLEPTDRRARYLPPPTPLHRPPAAPGAPTEEPDVAPAGVLAARGVTLSPAPPAAPAPPASAANTADDADEVARAATHVLLAACRPDQTASDAVFGSRPAGAFSHFLVAELRADPGADRATVLARVRERLAAERFRQEPQLDAPAAAGSTAWGRPYRAGPPASGART